MFEVASGKANIRESVQLEGQGGFQSQRSREFPGNL